MPRILCSICVIVVLVVLESSCRKRQVVVPLPSTPAANGKTSAPSPQSTTPTIPEPTPAPTPTPAAEAPTVAPETPAVPAPAAPSPTVAPKPDLTHQVNRQPPAAKKPAKPAAAAAGTPPAAPAAPTTAAPAPPRLGDILTPDQQREYNAAIDQSLARAQASLGSLGNRQLAKDQQSLVDQIRNFIQQALETRKSDLQGAKSLAERADVLARDLAAK